MMNNLKPQANANEPGYKCELIDSATFSASECRHMWLVENVLVSDQPAVIGGPLKSLKTSVGLDLAISLGSGRPFLDTFNVPSPRTVAVFSGESGRATIKETASRICASKGVRLKDCHVFWEFNLPSLGNQNHLQGLNRALRDHEVDVVIFDPLYLCLLAGSKAAASNLYEVGPILRQAASACLKAGATPVLIHHSTKGSKNKDPFLGLEDLAYAGIGEFARQWILLSRPKPYRMDGEHHLAMSVGSSVGHSSCWQLDISEGTTRSDFKGRRWQVSCSPPESEDFDMTDAPPARKLRHS